jgi:hypothetical protein
MKQPRGVDEGFCLFYFHLSYRRKFLRTLWVLVFSPILWFLPLPDRGIWFAVTLVMGIVQAAHNYWKWQTELKE